MSFPFAHGFDTAMLVVRHYCPLMKRLLAAIILLASAASGQSANTHESPNALIQRALDRFDANKKLAYSYTYIELWHNQNFDEQGHLKTDQTAKFQSVFIEDMPYLRRIEADGAPLTGSAADREEHKYEAAVRERKGMTLQQKQAEMRARNFTFPFDLQLLPKFYNNRVIGTETIAGRPAIHLDCVPRAGAIAKNPAESKALRVHVQVWIDVADQIFSRYDGELLAPANGLMAGSTASVSFSPIDGVWLPSHALVQGRTRVRGAVVGVKTELTYSDFQKFRVDVRVLDGNLAEIPIDN